MKPCRTTILYLGCLLMLATGCSPRGFTSRYYEKHATRLDLIESAFEQLHQNRRFSVGFTDKRYQTISLQIITDTLTYIYEFDLREKRLTDTLGKYGFNTEKTMDLIRQMQTVRCTWIKKVEYYVEQQLKSLIFISVKPILLHAPFTYKKYYILAYFAQAQYYDNEGRLLDKRNQKRIRKISGDIFYRINNRVAFTISGDFR